MGKEKVQRKSSWRGLKPTQLLEKTKGPPVISHEKHEIKLTKCGKRMESHGMKLNWEGSTGEAPLPDQGGGRFVKTLPHEAPRKMETKKARTKKCMRNSERPLKTSKNSSLTQQDEKVVVTGRQLQIAEAANPN